MKLSSHLRARCLLGVAVPLLASLPAVGRAQTAAPSVGAPEVKATAPEVKAPAAESKLDPERAEQAYLAGARAVDRKDLAAAQGEFARAVRLNPTQPVYALALDLTRQGRVAELVQEAARARRLDQAERANDLLADARAVDPHNELVLQHTAAGAPASSQAAGMPGRGSPAGGSAMQAIPSKDLNFAGPIQLTPAAGVRDLHLRGEVRQVVTDAARDYGLKTVFDESVTAQQIRFDLEATPYTQAMPILLRMARLFAVPLDAKTMLVVRDTQENRLRLERQVEETIFVPGSKPEQLNELQNIVKNVFDVRQVSVQQNASSLVVRAPEATLEAVNATLADLIDGGAQVMLELKLYTVDRSKTNNLGLNTPTSAGVFSIAAEAQSIVSANQTLINQAISQGLFTPSGNVARDIIAEAVFLIESGLATDSRVSGLIGTVGGGLTSGGVYLGSTTTLNLALNSSEARALDDITLRAGDRELTTFRIGSKYPITTSTYSSGVSAAAASSALAGVTIGGQSASSLLNQYLGSGGSGLTIPQITYEDLGLTLKTTPTVLKSGLISLHVDLKIEALTGASNNNIPVLTDTALISDIAVPEGSTALLLSELSTSQSAAISGLPGLASLPGFQESLADKLTETSRSELVLMITPHLIRRRSSIIAGPRIAFQTSVPADF